MLYYVILYLSFHLLCFCVKYFKMLKQSQKYKKYC